ncbi:MAG: bifunctional methylenetetrahydrofolate dehydrogenase/methenyltetrahydrofolate cyclohydrolase FolD [Deltaproteobacteria bacterium]|nr:MAG: bifunctional methylenetetrahydrofolate dehydrogenase/methenyltetrahydrofolate cyclohydrolase FolD [Deltaproteobacteria bacterium]
MELERREVVVDGVLRGTVVARHVRAAVAAQVTELARRGVRLRLALVRVGEDAASEVYVRGKNRACAEVGLASDVHHLGAHVSERDLLELIDSLNRDERVDGILVQLPLPPHLDAQRIIDAVDPMKDVDGFHPWNLGLLVGRNPLLRPCTPAGMMTLLDAAGFPPRGRHAVVVGRSVIVGRPIAQLLIRADATVTVCHRHTTDLEDHVRRADILVVATGVPGLVPGGWVKEGAVVLDVGINRLADGTLVGDVGFAEALGRAAAITPVPGGVGPMTVAMLLWNTVLAGAARRSEFLDDRFRPRFTGGATATSLFRPPS